MHTDTSPRGLQCLTATDRELCDRIRQLDAQIAALEPTDAAVYELNAERRELMQDMIVSKRSKAHK